MRWLSIMLCLLVALAPFVAADSGSDDDLAPDGEELLHDQEIDSETRIRVDSDGDVEIRERLRTADGEEIRSRERVRDGEVELRERIRDGDGAEVRERVLLAEDGVELRERLRSAEGLSEDLRERLNPQMRERLAKMSPAAIAALEESGRLEQVLANIRTQNVAELRLRARALDEEVKLDARARLASCEETDETCEEIRAEVHEEATSSLVGAIDALVRHLESTKASAAADEDLTAEQADAITAHVDAMLARAGTLRDEAMAAEDGRAVAGVAQQLGDLMHEAKAKTARTNTRTEGSKTLNALRRAEALDAQLACTLEGVDVEVSTARYEQLLSQARHILEEARILYEQEKLADARARVQEARDLLREAQDEAKLIIEELRSQGVELADCEVAVLDEEFSEDDLGRELEEDEIEIEAEFEHGSWKVKLSDGSFVLSEGDEAAVIAAAAERSGLSEEEVSSHIEFEYEELDADDESEDALDDDSDDDGVATAEVEVTA